MRWKLFAIQNPEIVPRKQTYGFNTTNPPPPMIEMKAFEDDLFDLIRKIEFKPVQNNFQTKLKDDIRMIRSTDEIIMSADKSHNKYIVPVEEYKKILNENITKEYRKSAPENIKSTNKEAATIVKKLEIDDRVNQFIQASAFITVKDHKPNFPSKVQCRLINPAKSNVGRISKQILERVVSKVKSVCGSNQWQSSTQVTEWFKTLENKNNLTFFKFDVVSYYPSINQRLFSETLKWAERYYSFSSSEKDVLLHAKKSFLFQNGEPWIKKNDVNFDVTMGSFDGAETCELVGLYVLSKLELLIEQKHLGLYRDDGLAVVNLTGVQIERLRKKVFALFKSLDLSVTIDANITETDFLDLYLDLKNNSYWPFRKENSKIQYIHAESNHPQSIKKQLPNMISKRISNLSCSKEVFERESPVYNDALSTAGYSTNVQFNDPSIPSDSSVKKKRRRTRNIIWFNPPYNGNVKTNLGSKFLALINKHFGNTELKKYFNRSTIKLSYSCMPNMESIISSHNRKLLTQPEHTQHGVSSKSNPTTTTTGGKQCNCRGGISNCPLEGKCLSTSLVYKAEVDSIQGTACYIGLASNTFKERYLNHTSSFRNIQYRESTALSKYIWTLKEKNEDYDIKWSVAAKAPSYSPTIKSCYLCLTEKTLILTSQHEHLLNKRNELMGTCRHRRKFLLSGIT